MNHKHIFTFKILFVNRTAGKFAENHIKGRARKEGLFKAVLLEWIITSIICLEVTRNKQLFIHWQ